MDARTELSGLDRASDAGLEAWLTRSVRSRYGAWSTVLRAIVWIKRDRYPRALVDVDAALAKKPSHERLELVCAMLLYVLGEYARSLDLLEGIAERHPYLARRTLRMAAERATRLGWVERRRALLASIEALGVRDLLAHLEGVRAPVRSNAGGAHAHDAQDLTRAVVLTLKTLEQPRARTAGAKAPSPAQGEADGRRLSPEDIARFEREGFIKLTQALPRAEAERVVGDAQRRLREEPQRWLPGESASIMGPEPFDPDDPGTWPRGRVDLLGNEHGPIAASSAFLGRAVAQLLAGCSVATSTWSNDLIAQFPLPGCTDWRPVPGKGGWHIDAPRVDTRLDTLEVGLLVLVLFSDLGPDGGNTWIAPGSVAAIARELAARPEGVDFIAPETARAISATCEGIVEVTGEAGDVFLVHPLMLHTASDNPSARTRWLNNLIIFVDQPLDHTHADPSPVERTIARALASAG